MKKETLRNKLQSSPFQLLPVMLPLIGSFLISGCSFQPDADRPRPTGIALVYGISDYDPPGPSRKDLTLCDDDAQAIDGLFSAQGFSTILKLDGEVTKEAITTDFQTAAGMLQPGDTFVMYFSGHGGQFAIDGSLEAASATGSTQSEADKVTLGFDKLEEVVALSRYFLAENPLELLRDDELAALFTSIDIPGVKKMLILDTCRSGGFIGPSPALDTNAQAYRNGRIWDGRTVGMLFDYFSRYTGAEGADILPQQTIVLTAAGEREDSFENTAYGHGIFTYFLLEAAKKGDSNLDGYVSATELFSYTADRIESDWNAVYPSARYMPRISGNPFDFMLFSTDP